MERTPSLSLCLCHVVGKHSGRARIGGQDAENVNLTGSLPCFLFSLATCSASGHKPLRRSCPTVVSNDLLPLKLDPFQSPECLFNCESVKIDPYVFFLQWILQCVSGGDLGMVIKKECQQ